MWQVSITTKTLVLEFTYWRNLLSHVDPVLLGEKVGWRTALLSGTVFYVCGLLAKINMLSESMNMVSDMSVFWRLYINGLLELRACCIPSMLWPGVAVPPRGACTLLVPFCKTWLVPNVWGGGRKQAECITGSSAEHSTKLPQFAVQRPVPRVGMPVMVICGFFYVFAWLLFLKKSNLSILSCWFFWCFFFLLSNICVSLRLSTWYKWMES